MPAGISLHIGLNGVDPDQYVARGRRKAGQPARAAGVGDARAGIAIHH